MNTQIYINAMHLTSILCNKIDTFCDLKELTSYMYYVIILTSNGVSKKENLSVKKMRYLEKKIILNEKKREIPEAENISTQKNVCSKRKIFKKAIEILHSDQTRSNTLNTRKGTSYT